MGAILALVQIALLLVAGLSVHQDGFSWWVLVGILAFVAMFVNVVSTLVSGGDSETYPLGEFRFLSAAITAIAVLVAFLA